MTGRPGSVASPERYVDARELAELMGVSPTTIKRMVVAGMPSHTWGMKRTRRYLPSEAIRWAEARATVTSTRDREGNAPGQHQPKE